MERKVVAFIVIVIVAIIIINSLRLHSCTNKSREIAWFKEQGMPSSFIEGYEHARKGF